MRQNIRSSLHCFAGVLLLSTVIAARAEEGDVGHYAPGSFASFVDALPGEPGVGAFNYFLCYAGSASANRQFPIAGQIALNVDATSCADSVGAFCITPLKILGANYAPGVALSFVWTDIKAQVSPPGGWHHEQQRFGQRPRRDRVLAAGAKLEVVDQQPARGFFRRHLRAFRRIPEESACQRLGYWTFEPGLLVSYLGQKSGFDFTTYIGYEIQHEEHGNGLPQWTGLPH